MDRCFYFGCWNEPGHFLFKPGGSKERSALELYAAKTPDEHWHLDGTLAPRWHVSQRDERGAMNYSGECPQGQFLRHVLPNGFTAISWWDRCQGDTRGACNSTILLEGTHTTAEMLEALQAFFPHVAENLKRAGVELIEVHESGA